MWLLLACQTPEKTPEPLVDPCHLPAVPAPACGSGPVARNSVIPGAADPGWDAALDARERQVERQANGVTAWATGGTTELDVQDAGVRNTLSELIEKGTAADLLAAGVAPESISWSKTTGAYAGVSMASDAWRYGWLRDEGAPCAEVDAARSRLLLALGTLHTMVHITGVEGVIARSIARKDLPGAGQTVTTPLFDENGAPLPEEKNNGTWREDNSGDYPQLIWEDSVSRDQYVGWIAAMSASWEVIQEDPTIPVDTKATLRADAQALLTSLMTVQESGYDLEIRDADGRMTYHGILNEQSLDRSYVPGAKNGLNSGMSLGIVAGLGHIVEDPAADAYLQSLLEERDLDGITRDYSRQVSLGYQTNFSDYNMVFLGGLLAQRYVCDADARSAINSGMLDIYAGGERDPIEQDQALYDLVAGLAAGGNSAWTGGEPDATTLSKISRILQDFPAPPFWASTLENCDADEIASGHCTLQSGATVDLLGYVGRGDELISDQPIPMIDRPPSNYYWRSNPYSPNATGSETALYPSVDWRLVYEAGRWMKR